MSYLIQNERTVKLVVKNANSYMCIKTESLPFLDVCSYLAPGFSYSQFLNAMEVEAKKFFWIYKKFTSLDVLKQTSFPKQEDFYSQLKQEHISDEDYAYCERVWKEQNMKTARPSTEWHEGQLDCLSHYK